MTILFYDMISKQNLEHLGQVHGRLMEKMDSKIKIIKQVRIEWNHIKTHVVNKTGEVKKF